MKIPVEVLSQVEVRLAAVSLLLPGDEGSCRGSVPGRSWAGCYVSLSYSVRCNFRMFIGVALRILDFYCHCSMLHLFQTHSLES